MSESEEEDTCGQCYSKITIKCGYLDCTSGFCICSGAQCTQCRRVLCFDCASPHAQARMEECTRCQKTQCQDCPRPLVFNDYCKDGSDNTHVPLCIDCDESITKEEDGSEIILLDKS